MRVLVTVGVLTASFAATACRKELAPVDDPNGETTGAVTPDASSQDATTSVLVDDGSPRRDAGSSASKDGPSPAVPPRDAAAPDHAPATDAAAPGPGASDPPPPPPPPPPADPSTFNFEADVQGWADLQMRGAMVARAAQPTFRGAGSLAITVNTVGSTGKESMERFVGVAGKAIPALSPGDKVVFHVYVPSGSPLQFVQAFVSDNQGHWSGQTRIADPQIAPELALKDAWNEFAVPVTPAMDVTRLLWLGVQVVTRTPGGQATIYVDGVEAPAAKP